MENYSIFLNVSDYNQTEDNVTFLNTTGTTVPPAGALAPPGWIQNYTNSIFAAVYIATRTPLALSGLVSNYYLLRSLAKVNRAYLKAKTFLQAMGVANALLAIVSASEMHTYVSLFGSRDFSSINCLLAFYRMFNSWAIYAQSVCSFGLALDRLYAVLYPIRYRTVGYGRVARAAMFVAPLVLPPLVLMTTIFSQVDTGLPVPPIYNKFCFIFEKAQTTLASTAGKMVLGFHTACFILYMVILIIIRFQQIKIRRLSAETSPHNMNIFGAYLMTNLSTLILYAPAPLLANLRFAVSYFIYVVLMRVFVSLYVLNSTLHPVILVYRIPSIKQNLPFDIDLCGKRQDQKTSQLTLSSVSK